MLLLGTAQEARFTAAAMKQLLGLGVELLLETTPVTPLLVAGDRVGGWVVLGRGGYLALPARMVLSSMPISFITSMP